MYARKSATFKGNVTPIFILEDPRFSERERNLQRSRALAHAARHGLALKKTRNTTSSQSKRIARRSNLQCVTVEHTGLRSENPSLLHASNPPTALVALNATSDDDIVSNAKRTACHDGSGRKDCQTRPWPRPDMHLLQRGSSDPFSCMPVDICPVTNHMIAFARDALLPAIFRSCLFGNKGSRHELRIAAAMGKRFVQRFIDLNLVCPETATAWVSTFTPMIANLLPERGRLWSKFRVTTIKLRARALQSVRQGIAQLQDNDSQRLRVLAQVVYLFAYDCSARQYDNARAHAVTIQHLGSDIDVMESAIRISTSTMYSDLELACSLFRPTLIDYSSWLPRQVSIFWTTTDDLVKSMIPQTCYDIHPCITDPKIKGAMTHVGQSLALQTLGLPMQSDQEIELVDTIYAWIATKSLYNASILLNDAVSTSESAIPDHDDMVVSRLATLTLLFHYTQQTTINGTDIRDASSVLTSALRDHLHATEDRITCRTKLDNGDQPLSSISNGHIDGELMFWIYFVGSYFEVRQCHNQPSTADSIIRKGDRQDRSFYRRRLAWQAQHLGLTQWTCAREVLQNFIYSDESTQPHPETWYEEAMSAASQIPSQC